MNKDLNFEYIEDFAGYIVDRVESDEELFLSVIGKFEEIKNVIKELMVLADLEFDTLNMQSPEVDGYTDEYVLDCWYNEGLLHIGCEPAKRDGEYFNIAGDETYLLEDCSSKIIPLCEDTKLYFVNIGEEHECGYECCGRCSCDYHDGDAEVVYYVVDGLTESDIITILEEFGF